MNDQAQARHRRPKEGSTACDTYIEIILSSCFDCANAGIDRTITRHIVVMRGTKLDRASVGLWHRCASCAATEAAKRGYFPKVVRGVPGWERRTELYRQFGCSQYRCDYCGLVHTVGDKKALRLPSMCQPEEQKFYKER